MFLIGEMGLVLLSALLISSFTVSAADGISDFGQAMRHWRPDRLLQMYETSVTEYLTQVKMFLNKTPAGLFEKALVFPYETADSYVTLTPQRPLELKAFTLCMRAATELKGEREIILFAYRTGNFDELNVWREKDGRYSFYLSGEGVLFEIPPLNTFKTHLCFTWESKTGLAAVWVDGKRSIRKVYKIGHTIRPRGTVLLGQDPDSFVSDFDENQSFVGEISDVNMWDYVLPETQIMALHSCDTHRVPKGNIFDWETIQYQIHGKVLVAPAD